MSIQARTLTIDGVTAGVTASIDANGSIKMVHMKPATTSSKTQPNEYLCTLKYQDAVIGISPASNSRTSSVIWCPGYSTASTLVSPAVAGDVDVIVTGTGLNGHVVITLLVEQ